jgi:hypothetical protein
MLGAIKTPCECGGWFQDGGKVSVAEAIDFDYPGEPEGEAAR